MFCNKLSSISSIIREIESSFGPSMLLNKKTKRLPAVVTYKDGSASESVDRAALFNDIFSSVYSSDNVNYEDL